MNAKHKIRKAALAYSGGLDTSIIVHWLRENYGCDVVCYCSDVGQGAELDGLEARARRLGASDVIVEDLRVPFVRDFVFPALRAGAVYEGNYLLGTALARPLIASRQVWCAERTGADALAHGCTGKGNDQVRFELTYLALAPGLQVIAPWREWDIVSREDALAYAAKHDLPLTVVGDGPERERLERQVERLGIGAFVRFVGAVAPADVIGYLATADIMLFPAQGEGFGLAAAEALMVGVPVVACWDGGGLLDVVPESGAGRLTLPSAEALSDAALDLIQDPDRLSLAKLVGESWRARLSPDNVAELCDGWYREALGG